MKPKFKTGQHVFFLIFGRYVTKAAVVKASPWFVTIRFSKKTEDCIIRLSYSRIFSSKEEARQHIHPNLSPMQPPAMAQTETGEFVCARRWELWQ